MDCIFANLYVTPERKESLEFSDPTYTVDVGVMVRDTSSGEQKAPQYSSLEDFRDKRIGVLTGTIQGAAVEKEFPKADVSYYNTHADLLASLRQNKIDAFSDSDIIIRYSMTENSDLTYLDEYLTEPVEIGAIFSKNEKGGIYEDGTPEQIFENPQRDLTRRFIRKLKVLELRAEDPYFDFAGMGTEIDRYCLQNDISPHTKYRIRLAFEELTSNLLGPVLEHVPVLITIEYSEKDGNTKVLASYGGEKFDPSESGDAFTYKVLSSTVSSLSYHYDPEAEEANTVKILI